jgi:hypothetical protein
LENIWSAGFGLLKFKSAGFGCRKMHFGMQALAIFFGSLQALDFTNQRKKIACRLWHPPPCYTPVNVHIVPDFKTPKFFQVKVCFLTSFKRYP